MKMIHRYGGACRRHCLAGLRSGAAGDGIPRAGGPMHNPVGILRGIALMPSLRACALCHCTLANRLGRPTHNTVGDGAQNAFAQADIRDQRLNVGNPVRRTTAQARRARAQDAYAQAGIRDQRLNAGNPARWATAQARRARAQDAFAQADIGDRQLYLRNPAAVRAYAAQFRRDVALNPLNAYQSSVRDYRYLIWATRPGMYTTLRANMWERIPTRSFATSLPAIRPTVRTTASRVADSSSALGPTSQGNAAHERCIAGTISLNSGTIERRRTFASRDTGLHLDQALSLCFERLHKRYTNLDSEFMLPVCARTARAQTNLLLPGASRDAANKSRVIESIYRMNWNAHNKLSRERRSHAQISHSSMLVRAWETRRG